jgi:hypothetical protein
MAWPANGFVRLKQYSSPEEVGPSLVMPIQDTPRFPYLGRRSGMGSVGDFGREGSDNAPMWFLTGR